MGEFSSHTQYTKQDSYIRSKFIKLYILTGLPVLLRRVLATGKWAPAASLWKSKSPV